MIVYNIGRLITEGKLCYPWMILKIAVVQNNKQFIKVLKPITL